MKPKNHRQKPLSIKPLQREVFFRWKKYLLNQIFLGNYEEIYVEGGDLMKANDLIAKIKVVPNLAALNQANNAIETALNRS